ncbi:MAG TPA: DUF1292 domain-containing protein [Firmicutes bacterium]|nr:DUF1292 domain-containing protein [Bacillota bacterium]
MLENEEYEVNLVTLIDEDGTERDFEVLEIIEVDGAEYVVIAPPEGDEDEDEALIFRLEVDPKTKEELLVDIEDDDEWDKVAEVYMGMVEEEE